jgi:hypothetical protein
MKKILKIAGIILAIIILIFVIYKIATYKEKTFNKFTFKTNHYVFNRTDALYLDTIVHAGLQKLDIDSVIVVIRPLINKEGILSGDMEFKAHIKGEEYSYIIYIGNFSRDENISILSHELIHLKQYYRNEIKIINEGKTPIWKGDTIDVNGYTYENRPWEKEAYGNQYKLSEKMKTLLYKKQD